MKFLADEDFPKPLTGKIRNLGYSVRTIQEKKLQGSSDEVVADIAKKEQRIILTFDKDFLKNQLQNLPIVVFHFPKIPTAEIISLIDNFLKKLGSIKLLKGKIYQFSKSGLERQ